MAKALNKKVSDEREPKNKVKHTGKEEINTSSVGVSICNAFKRVRRDSKLTQDQFATSLGVSPSYIRAIERKRFTPAHTVIFKLHKVYGKSIDWMFYYKEPSEE